MTYRRGTGWLRDLGAVPWWLHLVLGVAAFGSLRLAAARLDAGGEAPALDYLAWAALAGFLLTALWSFVHQWSRRRLLERQVDLDSIRELPWDEFQQLVGEAYRRLGYHVRETGADGRHGGADLVLRKQGHTTVVECRRWRLRKVRPAMLRELQGVMVAEQADYGILVTTGPCTPEAEQFARERAIALLDGARLLKLLQSVRREAMNSPRPAGAGHNHRCPHCGREMVLRTAAGGSGDGVRYWSCTGFPACRGSRVVGAVVGRSRARPQPLQRA